MFRKIYTGPLMYKMLVDELSESLRSQGIFTEERLETMMDKIEEIESKQFKNFSLRDYEGFERDPFKFTSRFLAQEIIKRKNDFETRPLHHKQLTKILGELLEKENKCTLLSVMVKYNYKVKDIPARELVMALENYKDPFNVTQENLLYLLNIGKNFDGIWERIEEVCDCLYLDQVVSLFQSMNSIHSYLGKKHSYEEPMDPIVKKMFGDRRSNKKKVKNGNLEEGKKEDKIEESVENLNQDKENLQESDDVIDVNELELKEKLDNFEEYLKFSGFNEDSSEDVEENIINEQNIEEMDNKIEQNKDDLLKTEGKSNKSKKGSKKKKENIEQTEDVTSNSEEGISKTKKSPDSIDLKLAPILESDTPTNQELIEKNEDIIQESELNKAESALKSKNFSMPNFIKLNNFKVNPNPKPKKSKPKEPKKFVFGDKNIKMYPDNPGKNIKEDFNRDINPKDTNRIPEHYIEKLLSRFLDLVDESNFQKICKVLDCSRELFPHKLTENMKKLQIALIEYPIFPDDFKPSEIASIVKNFPESGIKLNEDLVKSFGQKVEKIFPDLWHTDKIEVFQGLHRAGLKIPQKIVNSLEELDIEVLESLNSDKVLGFYQDLADSEVLTENLSQTIVESLLWNMRITTESFEKMAELIYKVHSKGFTSFLLNEPNYLLRVSHPDAQMNLEATLKFCIVYIANWSNPEIYDLLLRTFKRPIAPQEIFFKNLELIAEVQTILLKDSQEQPIFNYQIDSYANILQDKKKKLIDYIFKIIKNIDPAHPVVWQYYAEFLAPERPEDSDFLNKVNDGNLFNVCKSLWRYRPGMETCNEVIRNVFNITSFNAKDYTQEIYYLAACKPVAELFDWKWVNQDSLFYLPLCFELGVKPVVSGKLMENIKDNPGLFGEPLIKSLILCLKYKVNKELAKNLSKNLSFSPRNEPKTDKNLVNTLVESITSNKDSIDLFAFSIFVNKNLEIFEKEEILTLAKFFLPIIDKVFIGLKENFELIGVYPSTKFCEYPENDYKTMILTEDFSGNLNILRKIIGLKTNNTTFFSMFLKTLQESENKSEVLEGIKVSLEFLSMYGNLENSFEEVYKLLNKFQLWPLLTTDDLINFGFIEKFTSHFLPTSASEYVSPLVKHLKKLHKPTKLLKNSQGLHYYSPFKHQTTFEPRYITSNDLALYLQKPSYSEAQITETEFFRSIKIYYLLQKLNLPEHPETTQTINSYFMMKTKLKEFIKSTIDVKVNLQLHFNAEPIELNRDTIENPLTCLFNLLIMFKNTGAVMLLDSEMLIFDTDDNVIEISLPIKSVIKDFEKMLNTNIQTYNIKAVNKDQENKTRPFFEEMKKKNIYY